MIADETLDLTEVITRMSYVIYGYKEWDLASLDWDKTFEENGMDEYETTALITCFEHEFHTVFEDRVFENLDTLNQVRDQIAMDHNCF